MQKNSSNFPVEFVDDAFGDSPVLADVLKKVTGSEKPKMLIVADLNVVQRTDGIGSKIGRYVQAHGIALAGNPVVIVGGEKAKADNLQSAFRLVSAALSAKLGRDDVILAIGGGTILDLAGYAAAQVRGGVKIVRMPTTPAAMFGAAFADYAAVDSATVKDALRVPSVPAAVVIDFSFAKTVLDGVWRGGISEAVRQAVACDAKFARRIFACAEAYHDRDLATLEELVRLSVAVREKKGPTTFALWAALRLESMSGYKLPHGYAVAIGVTIDVDYAAAAGLVKPEVRDEVVGCLRTCGALDGMGHSNHLINQFDNLMLGLDAWALTAGTAEVTLPTGLGRTKGGHMPDKEILRGVLKKIVSVPAKA